MPVDVSGFSYFLPLMAFFIVFIILYALLVKTKILGDNSFTHLFVSFILAIVFVTAIGVKQYVLTVIPWFAVLIVCLFLIFMIIGFVGKPIEGMNKTVGVVFVVLLVIVFLVSAIQVFGNTLGPYLPGGGTSFADWVYSGQVVGALILLVIAGIVSWVLVKSAKS